MKATQAFLLALPALSAAYPGMGGVSSKAEMENYLRARQVEEAEQEKRDLISTLTSTVGALTNTIGGLLGSLAAHVDPNDKRPEPGYVFKDPRPSDSRGPCPGLNLLANYGYLPRDGHVTYGQVLEATSRGFNMGTDLAIVLATFATLANGDLATESFYLGSLNGVGGLNRHSTVEADVSPNREGESTPLSTA
jgi:hypothetical protein